MKLAFFLLNSNKNYIDNFKNALTDVKENISTCSDCHALIDG
jgi:recombinational DNA repair protein RecR